MVQLSGGTIVALLRVMNPRRRHAYLNESSHQNQNSDKTFLKGDRYHQYENTDAFRDYDKWAVTGRLQPGPWTQRESRSRDGLHAGKGPKFYRRTDASILEEVNDILTRDSQVDASEVEVKVKDSIVMLTGEVTDRKMKRLAEMSLDLVSGVRDIQNNIHVLKNGFDLKRTQPEAN